MAIGDDPLKQAAFLAAYAECGVISRAAEACDMSTRRHYEWLERDDEEGTYETAFNDAREHAAGLLETEARRRAIEGVKEPVYQKGECVGYKQKYSDTLLIFLMKGAMPDKYADRKQISGKGGGPLEIHEEIVFSNDDSDLWGDIDEEGE